MAVITLTVMGKVHNVVYNALAELLVILKKM